MVMIVGTGNRHDRYLTCSLVTVFAKTSNLIEIGNTNAAALSLFQSSARCLQMFGSRHVHTLSERPTTCAIATLPQISTQVCRREHSPHPSCERLSWGESDVLTPLSDCKQEFVENMDRIILRGSYMCGMDFHNGILYCGFLCA